MLQMRRTFLGLTGLVLALCCQPLMADSSAVTEDHVRQLLRDTTTFWTQEFSAMHGRYAAPRITFYSDALRRACKLPFDALGPFYCPANQHVYIDQAYLAEGISRAGSAASALTAYVIGHEVAHHVQAINGTTAAVEQARSRSSPELATRTLNTMELQADCYAGLWLGWAQSHGKMLKSAELPRVLSIIADVSRQRQSLASANQQLVDPLTHGTETQRLHWLQLGMESGKFTDCDTFAAESAGKL